MHSLNKPGKKSLRGELFILGAALAGSLLPIFSNTKSISISPFWMAALGTLISLLIFLILCCIRGFGLDIKKHQKAIYQATLAGIIIGFFYNGLVYIGAYYTSPQNASIIVTMDVFVAMLLFRKTASEDLSAKEIFGGCLLVSAGAMLFLPSSAKPQLGDFILLIACLLTPIGNMVMKKARRSIPSHSILFIRTIVSSILLCIVAYCASGAPEIAQIKESAISIILSGILVLSLSKILWLEGINLIPIAKASSIASTAPVLTYIFAWLFLNDLPSWNQLIAMPVCLIGFWLVVSKNKANLAG